MIAFLSGPISGHRFYRLRFWIAALFLRFKGYKVHNPAILPGWLSHDQAMHICCHDRPLRHGRATGRLATQRGRVFRGELCGIERHHCHGGVRPMALIMAAVLTMTPIADTGEPMIPRDDQRLYAQIIEAEAHPSWSLDGLSSWRRRYGIPARKYGETYREVLTRDGNYSVYRNKRYGVGISHNALIAVNLVLRGSDKQNFGQMYFCTADHLARNPHGLARTVGGSRTVSERGFCEIGEDMNAYETMSEMSGMLYGGTVIMAR